MRNIYLIVVILVLAFASGCSKPAEQANTAKSTAASPVGAATPAAASPAAAPVEGRTPSNKFTAADVAKLKWLEGTWKGMDDDKPFFQRYHFDGTTMIVDNFEDPKMVKPDDTTRFELKDGDFGADKDGNRSSATDIGANHVQFVPVGRTGNSFRFDRQADGTWVAKIEWAGPDGSQEQKTYIMEPYKK